MGYSRNPIPWGIPQTVVFGTMNSGNFPMIATPTIKTVPLGQVVATPGVLELMERNGQTPIEFLQRHSHCDWGDVCHEDWNLNDQALVDGTRLLSAYHLRDGTKIWVITEWNRSATTLLLPEEY